LSALSIVLWVAGAFFGLRLIVFALAAHTFARLRLLPHALRACAPEQLPEALWPLFLRAVQELSELGFETRGAALLSPLLEGDASPTPYLALRHRDGTSGALVHPAGAPTAAAPFELQLVSHFADGSALVTLSGQKFSLPFELPSRRVQDHFRASWQELVHDHLQELARAPAQALTLELEPLLAGESRDIAAGLASLRAAAGSGGLLLPWARVLRLALRSARAMGAYQKLQGARLKLAPWAREAPEAQRWIELRALRLSELVRALPPRRSLLYVSFVLSGALFALSMALYGSLTFIVQITLVVLVHEFGHWGAMRLTGYRQPTIFFVPFFGAATSGHKPDATLWQELAVLLAGPLPGLALGGALLASGPLPVELHELARLAIFVNAANLLPLWPLDGGRVLQRLLLRDRPRLELALCLLSAGAFAVLAVSTADPLLALLAVGVTCSAHTSFQVSRCAERALGQEAAGDVLASALRATEGLQEGFPQRVAIVRGVVERLCSPRGTRLQRWLGGVGYASLVVVTALLIGQAHGAQLAEPSGAERAQTLAAR
jgi:Zn-dependent protease